MARQYLSVPASSATVERLFSVVGIAFAKIAGRLTKKLWKALHLCKAEHWILGILNCHCHGIHALTAVQHKTNNMNINMSIINMQCIGSACKYAVVKCNPISGGQETRHG